MRASVAARAIAFAVVLAVSALGMRADAAVDELVGATGNPAPVLYYELPESRGDIDDLHPVQGVELRNGDYALVGKAIRCETCEDVEGFLVLVDGATGRAKWTWTPNVNGRDDVLNAVVEVPDGTGDLIVVGYQTARGSGGAAMRSVSRVDSSGREIWTSTDFGDANRSHGAWEMVTVSDDGRSLLLSGVHKAGSKDEFWFKSYGNVSDGKAIVMEIPIELFAAPVSAASASWSKEWNESGMTTAKAARPVPGGGVVVLLWGEDEERGPSSASLQLFDADRRSVWGPIRYGEQHGEGTDVAVSADGSSFVISGHGCVACEGELLGKLTKVRSDGAMLWSRPYASCDPNAFPSCSVIFNECWGVGAIGVNDGFVLACGTGIESCEELSGSQRRQCLRDRPVAADPRPGAQPRPPAVWASLVVRVDEDGDVLWQRVDQYREDEGPTAGAPGWEAWSSASEYVIVGANGDLAFVQDEVSGIGLLKLSGDESTSPPPKIDMRPPGDPTRPPASFPDPIDPCVCAEIYDPVCGAVSNVTFGNECMARCAGESFIPGPCPDAGGEKPAPIDPCMCTKEYAPVCGVESKTTYGNACMARCNGEPYVPGPCSDEDAGKPAPIDPCPCPMVHMPVCGLASETTYGNACMARCAGEDAFIDGACAGTGETDVDKPPSSPPGCQCNRDWKPVCDTQADVTYANACFAGCAGVAFTPGHCKDIEGSRSSPSAMPDTTGNGGGVGDQDREEGEETGSDELLWALIEFLKTAEDALDPELTTRFLDFLDALFQSAVTFDTNRRRNPPPALPPPPPPPPSSLPIFGPSFRESSQPQVQPENPPQEPDTARFRELIERITRAIPAPLRRDEDSSDRPIARFVNRVRRGGEPSVTLSAYDAATVAMPNSRCSYPFEYSGVLYNSCVSIDGSDMCKDAFDQFIYCYEMDAVLFDPLVASP